MVNSNIYLELLKTLKVRDKSTLKLTKTMWTCIYRVPISPNYSISSFLAKSQRKWNIRIYMFTPLKP